MKILYGITKSNFGGAQRYVFELAEEAKKRGHDVAVVCGGEGVLTNKLNTAGIRVISLEKMQRNVSVHKEFVSFFQILKILKKEQPDVFHINSSKMGGLGGLAGRFAGIAKIIFTSHGWAFNETRSGLQKLLIKIFAWITVLLAHTTICVSQKTNDQIAHWPFVKNKLLVVHNGIKEFDLAVRKDMQFTVGSIGELHNIKGQDILLKAWRKFIRNHQARLVIIGEGEERENLVNTAKNLGISDTVEFRGYVDNARSLLSNFDITVFPSRSENLPYAILEAGLAGRAVIATSVGGIPEIIESGMSGILVLKEDDEALFSSLLLLADDEELRKRLGTNLQTLVKEKFPVTKMFAKTFAVYEKSPPV